MAVPPRSTPATTCTLLPRCELISNPEFSRLAALGMIQRIRALSHPGHFDASQTGPSHFDSNVELIFMFRVPSPMFICTEPLTCSELTASTRTVPFDFMVPAPNSMRNSSLLLEEARTVR